MISMMRLLRRALPTLLFALIFVGSGATAQSVLGEVKACSWIEDDEARLACFDSAVESLSGRAATSPPVARPDSPRVAEPVRPAPPADRAAAPEERDRGQRREREAEDEGDSTLTISRVASTRLGKLVLTMDNGEVWRQTDTQSLPPIEPGMAAVVREGVFGGYRLSVGGRTIRAEPLQ